MPLTSVVEADVNLPQARAAELFSDPRNNTKWMDDVDRTELISGDVGMPGSTYRLVPKQGDMVFVATVLARDLPAESRLSLDASNVTVSVTGTFASIGPHRTRLVSTEVFTFKGLVHRAFGLFAGGAIRKAHRRHIDAFKRFAEAHG